MECHRERKARPSSQQQTAVGDKKNRKSGPTAGERADLRLVKKSTVDRRIYKEDWLRQSDLKDPRSGRVAAKIWRGT